MKIIDKIACPSNYSCKDCKNFILYDPSVYSICLKGRLETMLYNIHPIPIYSKSIAFCEDYEVKDESN